MLHILNEQKVKGSIVHEITMTFDHLENAFDFWLHHHSCTGAENIL